MLAEQALRRGAEVAHGDLGSMRDWFPVSMDADPATVWWRFAGERRFTEPFFEDSLVVQDPHDRRVCRTPLAVLDAPLDSVAPTAFIFHVSRCGSTLLTQMLAGLPQCIVMSEPPVLDAFFRLQHHDPASSGGAHTLRGLVAALGQRRDPGERHLFIKFDSWHMPWMPFVREAFPSTPIVLLYREPGEVLASHRRQRGAQMVPGLADTTRLRPDTTGLAPADLDGYAARMVQAMFDAALDALQDVRPHLLDYSELPAALWTGLAASWGVEFSPGELEQLQARSGFHSKHAQAPYAGDAPAGPQEKGRQPAAHVYAQLEAARVSCATGRCLPSR